MSMRETETTAKGVLLREHETTGLLPVGFEFERHGARYDQFSVSTDGFIGFAGRARQRGLSDRIRLVDERSRLGAGHVTYEVRGSAPRRRLVISLTEDLPGGAVLEVTVHERTGIVEVGAGGQSFGEPTIRQLDRVQSSSFSRVNSARKIG